MIHINLLGRYIGAGTLYSYGTMHVAVGYNDFVSSSILVIPNAKEIWFNFDTNEIILDEPEVTLPLLETILKLPEQEHD